jgi:hypothetical protein
MNLLMRMFNFCQCPFKVNRFLYFSEWLKDTKKISTSSTAKKIKFQTHWILSSVIREILQNEPALRMLKLRQQPQNNKKAPRKKKLLKTSLIFLLNNYCKKITNQDIRNTKKNTAITRHGVDAVNVALDGQTRSNYF